MVVSYFTKVICKLIGPDLIGTKPASFVLRMAVGTGAAIQEGAFYRKSFRKNFMITNENDKKLTIRGDESGLRVERDPMEKQERRI